jgi:TRAP-type uncharacterized transport system fused permease subunit
MVDIVRSLRWFRSISGSKGVLAVGVVLIASLVLAYGPVAAEPIFKSVATLPMLGEIGWVRLLLFCMGVLFVVVPTLQGFPIIFMFGLSIARWEFPSELLWLGQIPYVGFLLPLTLAVAAAYLIAMPVFTIEEKVRPTESASELGRSILIGLENGAKNSLGLVAATSSIGLIVGLLVLAALGVRISIMVTEIASTSLFLAFFLVMIASLVLGMGLPTIAAYILLVIVVAPSITELGAPLVAAHMFIFYFGVISSITPPVALAAYAASGISGANAMQTGFTACRLAITAFIVPYLFVYYPELLLLQGTFWEIAYRFAVSCAGIVFIAMAAMGYGRALLRAGDRIVMAAAALLLFLSSPLLNAIGLLVGVGHMIFRQNAQEESTASSF